MGDWYLEALQNFLNSAEWRDTIRIYVDAHCQYFIQIAEYHPQQFVIWKNFQEIAENVLDNALQMVGGSMDLLEKALDDVKHRPSRGPRDEIIKDVIDQLLSFESFDTFALMMNQSCMEKLNDEGKGDVEDCDCHTLMRMGFTVNNINHAYDEVGQTATLEDLLLYLTHKQSIDNARSGDNSYKATPSNTSQKKSLKVQTQNERYQDDYIEDPLITDEEVYRSHQRYVSPLDKFIVEAKDTYNLDINPNELNAKFAIAESVLSNYQDTVLHQQQQQTSGDANNDQLLALTRWAAEMKSLQGDIFTAYNEDIPCQDLCFNSPKGLIGWYLELEELRHEINESYKTNPSSSGLSGTAGASIISDNELQRMAELDKIAAMGTEDEQRLHSLLSRHEMIRKEILQLYHKCNILINTNKDIKRNMIEEVYLLLKEKVKKLNKINNNNHDEQMINEEAIWEDPIIQEMIHHEHGLEIIHQLLELHILEDEQHMIKVEIHQLIGSPSAASAASFANDFKEGSGGSDDKKSDSRGFADAVSGVGHLDELFNFDAKLLDEANAPLSFADAKESKASASALSPSSHTGVVSAAIEKKADFPAAKDTAESKMPSAPSSLPPILSPNKRLMETNPHNEVIDLLKNQHRQALQSLKDSLSLLKQQKLSNLENRLLLKKKLLANARASAFDDNNKTSSEENTLFIQNEEKDINQLENEIYQQQIAFNSLENSMVDGFKSRCIYELKTAKTLLDQDNTNKNTGRSKDAKDAISPSEQLVALTEKIQQHLKGKGVSNEENEAAASELAKSILEKYEKDKAYLMQNLQQQRLKQYQKLQKRLQSKLQKQPSSAANDIEQQEQYEKQMKQIDQQYEEEMQSTLQSLQESLFMTLAGSELQTPVLLSSLTAANKSNEHHLSDDYLQSEEEKMISQHSPTISYLNSLDHLKSKYLQASNQLFQSLQHSKIHQNENLQRRRRQLTSSSTPQENKELLEQEALLQNEILEVVDHVILDAYTSHLNEMIEEKKAKFDEGEDDDDRRFRYKSLSDKIKKQRNGKSIDNNNNENDDELNERMKIGLLNSYEKSKQSYDLRKKEQQLSGKDHLQKRLEQRRAGRGNDGNSSNIWEDVQTENVIESFMDKFLSQPSPSRSSSTLSPEKKSHKPVQNEAPLASVSKDNTQDSRKSNDAKAAWNTTESHNNNKSAEDTSRIKAIHQEKEKELMDNLYSNMLDKKRKLEERIRKKRELGHNNEGKDDFHNEENDEGNTAKDAIHEKELLDQMQAIERAYDIMKHSFGSTTSTGNSDQQQSSLAKLISMMESIINKTEKTVEAVPPSSTLAPLSLGSNSMSTKSLAKSESRDAFVGEARRISTAYTEEQNKLDLMMKIQQTRQRQALQRKLWERNQAKMAANQPMKKSMARNDGDEEEEEDVDEESEEIEGPDTSIQIAPSRSALHNLTVRGPHQDSVRGLVSVPTIAEARDKQSFALRGLNLGPMRRK